MSETFPPVTPVSGSARATPQRASTGYQAGREVERHAASAGSNDDPHLQKAIGRLQRILNSGEPLRDDVPRGYYLNVVI